MITLINKLIINGCLGAFNFLIKFLRIIIIEQLRVRVKFNNLLLLQLFCK